MDKENIIQILKEDLLNTQGGKVRAGIEISVRCPYCGDSDNPDHSHFYIGFSIEEEGISLPYHCKKCGISGGNISYEFYQRITSKANDEIRIFLNKLNKGAKLLKKALSVDDIEIPQWKLQDRPTEGSKSDMEKINFFNKRTGLKLSPSLIKKFKIILNLKNFLRMNEIKKNLFDEKFRYIINNLSENYIGFLSYYNNYIYLRHKLYKPPPGQMKHHRMLIKGYRGRFLYIPSNYQVNLMTEKPKLALTEGVFDLINVQKRFYENEQTDMIFAASGSKGSLNSTINEVISITGFVDLDVTLYADSDVDIKNVKKDMFGLLSESYKGKVIYHKGLKDFGNFEEGYQGIIKYEV